MEWEENRRLNKGNEAATKWKKENENKNRDKEKTDRLSKKTGMEKKKMNDTIKNTEYRVNK